MRTKLSFFSLLSRLLLLLPLSLISLKPAPVLASTWDAQGKEIKYPVSHNTSNTSPFRKFYSNISVGYGFPISNDALKDDCDGGCGYSCKPCCLGQGLQVGLDFGYRFNPYLSLEIGGTYVAWHTTDAYGSIMYSYAEFDSILPGFLDEPGAVYNLDTRSLEGMQMGQLSLQLVASPGFTRWNPYVKAGLGFVMSKFDAVHTLSSELSKVTVGRVGQVFERVYRGPVHAYSFGFVGALGVSCHLNDLLSLYFEWQYNVYIPYVVRWESIPFESETGNREALESADVRVGSVITRDRVGFNNHGLKIGIQFKF